jgi:hypothetical protein
MAHFRRSRVVYRDLDRVFSDESNRKIDGYICALGVLFEDMRIELAGLAQSEIKPLDVAGMRISYFLRRSIATLKEFAHAITDLDKLPEFAPVKAGLLPETLRDWDRAVRFFGRYGKTLITPVRHTIGGHFRHETAERVLSNELGVGVPGGLEAIVNELGKGGFILHFAPHIANAAITDKVVGTGDYGRKFRFLFRRVNIGYRHAVRATEAIITSYLWGKFEG